MNVFRGWAALACVGLAASVQFRQSGGQIIEVLRDIEIPPRSGRGKGQNNRRGKGARTPPKARSNRLTVSKRVRRKHRRAA